MQLGFVEFVKPKRVNKADDRPFQESQAAPVRVLREMRVEGDEGAESRRQGDGRHLQCQRAGRRHRDEQGPRICRVRSSGIISAAAAHRTDRCSTARRVRSARRRFRPRIKGMRMAGHLGNDRVTVQNLQRRARRSGKQPSLCARRGARTNRRISGRGEVRAVESRSREKLWQQWISRI